MKRLLSTLTLGLALSKTLHPLTAGAAEPAATGAAQSQPSMTQKSELSWKTVPTQTINAGGVDYTYREMGQQHGGTPVVFLVHLAAVLDNWDPRIMDGIAAKHHVIAFNNRGIGSSSGSPANSIEQMADDAISFSMGGMVAQEVVLKEPQLVRKMVLAGTGPAGGEGISSVAGVTFYDMLRGLFTGQDPKQFLFFTRTPSGIEAGKAFLARLQERTENRDKEITNGAFFAQLGALRAWGNKAPADLSVVKQPVLVVNGDNDRMVPTVNTHDLAKRLPNSQLIIYPDAGHGGAFQCHAEFVRSTLEFLAR
jgi:pimeloyl-ACP methyl ester carboxylesterase